LVAGDVVTFQDLLYGMLLPSGNDAACAVARTVGAELLKEEGRSGDPSLRFVEELNRLAVELGLRRTHFQNPHGRDSQGQISCAWDIALLAKEAFAMPAILQSASTRTYRFALQGDYPRSAQIESTNKMLEEDDIFAGKTGSTRKAGGCLVVLTAAKQRRVIVVVLGSPVSFSPRGFVVPSADRRYDDIRKLLAAVSGTAPRAALPEDVADAPTGAPRR
jgi:D-alanyl-D-alanine carboxypeptidase (penicillin-binding protein 5/6)